MGNFGKIASFLPFPLSLVTANTDTIDILKLHLSNQHSYEKTILK